MNGAAVTPAPAASGQAVREARRGLAEARDDQVLKVVSILDSLENRGAGDEVLAPVRVRLKMLQPRRPLRLARLLFLPLDPLIQAAASWRPGSPYVPRNAIAPLSALVRDQADQGMVARVDGLIGGGQVTAAEPEEAGALLWPHAAMALRKALQAGPPTSWMEAGLPAGEFVPIVSGLVPVLLAEPQLRAWSKSSWQATYDAALAGLLRQAVLLGPRAWGMMLALLLFRFPDCPEPFEAALTAGGQPGRMFRDAADAALGVSLSGIEDAQPPCVPTTREAVAEIGRLASLVDGLASRLPDQPRRERVGAARAQLQRDCIGRFRASLECTLTAPLQALAGAADDKAVEHAESQARRLRQFEAEARRLGGGSQYDALLGSASQALANASALNRSDRARLVEILQGPEAALRCLRGTP